jgi:hypothetical protein
MASSTERSLKTYARRQGEKRTADRAAVRASASKIDPVVLDFMEKCQKSPRYFIECCLSVQPMEGGEIVPFILNPGQDLVMQSVERQLAENKPVRVLCLKSRRHGISTLGEALAYWGTSNFPYKNGMVVAHKKVNTGEIFRMAKLFYDTDSRHKLNIAPEILESNAMALRFGVDRKAKAIGRTGLNSQLLLDSAEGSGVGVGLTLHVLHLSELGKWVNEMIMPGLMVALTRAPGTIGIAESTAEGVGNTFHKMWKEAEAGRSEWDPVFLSWLLDPNNWLPVSEREAAAWSFTDRYERDLYEKHGASLNQIKWRRMKLSSPEMMRPGYAPEEIFKQEFPACLTGEVRVSTERGIIPISEILGCRETESGRIVAAGPQPESMVYRLTTKAGRTIRGTFDHPVHTPSGEFVWLGQLQPGQEITLRPPRFAENVYVHRWNPIPGVVHSVEIDETWGRFLGYFMGDGSWYKYVLSIVCDAKDEDTIADVQRVIRAVMGDPHARTIAKMQGRKGAVEWRLGCKAARDVMLALGTLHRNDGGKGSYKRTVCVPEAIWRSPKPVVREFLRGLFESDGSASGNKVSFATCKPEFARDVQLLLLGFGINGAIVGTTKKAGSGNTYYIYTITLGVVASRRFHDEIGFVSARKQSGRPEETHLGRPAVEPLMVDEVLSVEEDRVEVTYDLTVEPEHVFSANGILTHNTPEEAFLTSGKHFFLVSALEDLAASGKGVKKPAYRARIPLEKVPADRDKRDWKALHIPPVRDDYGELYVWEEPKAGEDYVIGGDPAQGLEHGDNSVAWVLKRSTLEFVARLKSRKFDSDEFGQKCALLGWWYNTALIGIEINGPGVAANSALRRVHYNRVWYDRDIVRADEPMKQYLGWRTSTANRRSILERLEEEIRRMTVSIPAEEFFAEARTFQLIDGRPEAIVGCHDDEIMSAAIAVQIHLRGGAVRGTKATKEAVPALDFAKPKSKENLKRKREIRSYEW